MTLVRTRVVDIMNTGKAMTETLEEMGLENFSFVRDTKKVKLYVAMVPLMKVGDGKDWKIENWQEERSFDRMAVDIERSNPGIYVCVRPSWLGK